jgi:CzcA family heavy metal efflux pump
VEDEAMMAWIVQSSLRFRPLIVGIAVATMIVGIAQLGSMPRDVVPEFAPPYVEIQTEALGLSAEEVEQLITVPIEADLLAGLPWVDVLRSESLPGLSSVVVVFKPGTDLFRARQMVAERLTQAHALPQVSKPPAMLQPLSSASRVMMIGVSSKELSLIEMSVLARWTIRPRLMGIPGVANVAIWGQREQQLQVQVDPARLRSKGVTLGQVIDTTGNALWVSPLSFLEASTPGTGGFIDTPNQRLGIQHISPITTPEDLAAVTVEDSPLRLGEVATVVQDHQPLIGDAVINDGPGLLLVVEKFPDANVLDVTRGLDQALRDLRPGLTGVDFDASLYRPANFIESATQNLAIALLVGIVLVALMLGIFFFSWRAAVIGIVAIPLALVAAGLVLYALGATVNSMTVAGLVIAVVIVIDDAIVGINQVIRRRSDSGEADDDESVIELVFRSTLEVRRLLVYASLIIGLALMPVFFVGGAAGAFLPTLAAAYALAVVASMLVGLTVTPALGLILFGGSSGSAPESPLIRGLQARYAALLGSLMRRARPVLVAVGVVTLGLAVVLGVALAPQFGGSLLPTYKERDLLIHFDGPQGTSQPEMNRVAALAGRELRAIPGVRSVGGQVGRAVTSDQIVGINAGELWVSIDPAADYDKTVAAIRSVIDGYPGLRHEVRTYPTERMDQVLAGTGHDAVVRVYGQELPVLRAKADEVRQAVQGIDGVSAANVLLPAEEPTLEVEVDLAAVQKYGLKPGDVRRASATLLSGLNVGNLFEDQKVFDVVVWGVPELRTSLSSIGDLLIDTPSGAQVRLADVAKIRIAPAPSKIDREGVFRYVDVGLSVKGRDVGAVIGDVNAAIQRVGFPLEYRAEILSGAAELQAGQLRLWAITIAAAIGILLLLQAAFGSWRLAVLVFITLPVALVGGALGAVLSGNALSLGSIVGLLTVVGVSARTGLLLISRLQRLEREARDAGEAFGAVVVLRGAREQLGPILITVLASCAFLAPMAIADVTGFELLHPMALVVLLGMVTSALVSLFIVPALYLTSGPTAEADTSSPLLAEQPSLSPA